MRDLISHPSWRASERGIAMVALLVSLSVMGIMLSVAMPAWQTASRREKEAELVFRGEQYARAIGQFQRKYGNTSPPTVDVLVTERFLRKKYIDPITKGEFELLSPGSAIQGSSTPTALQQTGRAGTAQGGGSASIGLTPVTIGNAAGGRGAQPQTTGGRGTTTASTTGGFRVGSSMTVSSGTGGTTGGIIGVRSKSKDKSLRLYKGAETYDQWLFVATQQAAAVSGVGAQVPGGGAGRGQAPGAGGRGARGGQAPTAGRGQPQGAPGRGDAPAPQRGGGGRGGAGGGFGGGGGGLGGGRGF